MKTLTNLNRRRRSASQNRIRRGLSIEGLEHRELMAADVTAGAIHPDDVVANAYERYENTDELFELRS